MDVSTSRESSGHMVGSTDLPPAPSTNDARQSSNRLARPLSQRGGQRRGGLRLRRDDPRRRPQRAHRRADAAQQSAAADCADDRIDVGEVFENLESQRGVSRDEAVIVEGMHESAAHAR